MTREDLALDIARLTGAPLLSLDIKASGRCEARYEALRKPALSTMRKRIERDGRAFCVGYGYDVVLDVNMVRFVLR